MASTVMDVRNIQLGALGAHPKQKCLLVPWWETHIEEESERYKESECTSSRQGRQHFDRWPDLDNHEAFDAGPNLARRTTRSFEQDLPARLPSVY
jgi:hypothetical protein